MSLRRRSLGLLGALAIGVAACGGSASPTPAPSTPAGSPRSRRGPDGAPTRPRATSADFKFALDGEPTYFSYAYTDLPTSWIVSLLYDGLYVHQQQAGRGPRPRRRHADTSGDGLTWTSSSSRASSSTTGPTSRLRTSCSATSSACPRTAPTSRTAAPAPGQRRLRRRRLDDSTLNFVLKQKYAPFARDRPDGPHRAREGRPRQLRPPADVTGAVDAADVDRPLRPRSTTATTAEDCAADKPPADRATTRPTCPRWRPC